MRRVVVPGLLFAVAATACGGVQVPTHNGYKGEKVKPWKKPKTLKLNDKLEAKAEGDLSYADMRRAMWFAVDTVSLGTLDLRVEITPPGDATNDDFDLGMETYDAATYKMLSRADLDEADAHELNKKQSLVELPAGKYLIHLYLQGRLDTAEYVLHVAFHATTPSAAKSDFPAQVAFVPILPMVPLDDDTPKSFKPPPPVVTHVGHRPPPTPTAPTPPKEVLTARILGISVVGKGTQITVGRGTSSGASAGMKAKIQGVPGTFTLDSCSDRTCVAVVSATPDQIKSAGTVTLMP